MPRNSPLRIVVDTNLWISFIISKRYDALDSMLYSQRVRLLFSIELIEEIEATIAKPKLKKHLSGNALQEMLIAFDSYIDLITVESEVAICRDPNDDFLLALAKDGKADYLLTGDNDLLSIGRFEKTSITTFTDFIKISNRKKKSSR